MVYISMPFTCVINISFNNDLSISIFVTKQCWTIKSIFRYVFISNNFQNRSVSWYRLWIKIFWSQKYRFPFLIVSYAVRNFDRNSDEYILKINFNYFRQGKCSGYARVNPIVTSRLILSSRTISEYILFYRCVVSINCLGS